MNTNELDLGLREQAPLIFEWLEALGFSCTDAQSSKIRYESKVVYIEVDHSRHDGEVSISFGRIEKMERLSFTLFLRLVNPTLEKEIGERLAYDRGQLHDCLVKLSQALQREGKPILSGDWAVFEKMTSVRWWDFQPQALKNKPHS